MNPIVGMLLVGVLAYVVVKVVEGIYNLFTGKLIKRKVMNNNQLLYFYKNNNKTGRRQTIAGIVNEAEHTLSVGVAECSKKDQFVKAKGRKIATGRANSTHSVVLSLESDKKPVEQFITFVKTL